MSGSPTGQVVFSPERHTTHACILPDAEHQAEGAIFKCNCGQFWVRRIAYRARRHEAEWFTVSNRFARGVMNSKKGKP